MRIKLICLSIMFLLCACATNYKSQKDSGQIFGYIDTLHAVDSASITFIGNQYTAYKKVQDFALLRVSELAALSGYKYFVILKEENLTELYSHITPAVHNLTIDPSVSSMWENKAGKTEYVPASIYDEKLPGIKIEVKFYSTKPTTKVPVYDAEEIYNMIKIKYNI